MRRRPLALLCLAAVLVLGFGGAARVSGQNAALFMTQEYLSGMADAGGTLILEGSVAEVNAVSEGVRLSVNQIFCQNNNSTGTLSSELKLLVTVGTDTYLPGDRIRITGDWRPFTEASNPGQFDTQAYYFAKNTLGSVTSPTVTLVAEGTMSLPRTLARIRRALRSSYLNILREKAARTVSAISLGEKSFMEQEWKQLYQEGGIAHIISISGLHISLIGMCIYRLLRRARLPFAPAALPAAAIVVLYALMSGFGISTARACVMFAIWLGSQIAGRKNDMLTSTAIAAALILAGDAGAATQSSFLLSFGAVLSIALLVPQLAAANPFRRSGRREAANPFQESEQSTVGNPFRRSERRRAADFLRETEQPAAAKPFQRGERKKEASGTNDKHAGDYGFEGKESGAGIRQKTEKPPKTGQMWRKVCKAGSYAWNALSGGVGIWIGVLPVTLWFFIRSRRGAS